MSSIYYKNQKYTGPTLDLGSGSLTTDNKTIVGAINELDAEAKSITTGDVEWDTTNVTGDPVRKTWERYGRLVVVHLEFTPISGQIANNNIICTGLPIPRYHELTTTETQNKAVKVTSGGSLIWYYPQNTEVKRCDLVLTYFASL